MLYTRVLRSRIDFSKAMALAGVKTILTHENCEVVWGAGATAGGRGLWIGCDKPGSGESPWPLAS